MKRDWAEHRCYVEALSLFFFFSAGMGEENVANSWNHQNPPRSLVRLVPCDSFCFLAYGMWIFWPRIHIGEDAYFRNDP